jgi:hypothetical protein
LARTIEQEKEGIQIGDEEVKLFLFAKTKQNKNLLELITNSARMWNTKSSYKSQYYFIYQQ